MHYSKERLFKSCNQCGHCLATHITPPINIGGQLVDVVYILNLVISELEYKRLLFNIENSINTINGNITVLCFLEKGNPYDPLKLTIPLNHISEIESIELN